MILTILIIGIIFIGIGFILTENNAKYLLSGYNTMSKEERKNFDIKTFIPFFKLFHIFLGLTIIVFGLLFDILKYHTALKVLLIIYPILMYIYFICKSNYYYIKKPSKINQIGIVLLSIILVFIIIKLF